MDDLATIANHIGNINGEVDYSYFDPNIKEKLIGDNGKITKKHVFFILLKKYIDRMSQLETQSTLNI